MSKIRFLMDSQSIPSWARPLTGESYHRVLAAGAAAVSISVPEKSHLAIFNADNKFWVSDENNIVLPGGSWTQNRALLSPSAIIVRSAEFDIDIDNLWFRATEQTTINIAFYTR